LRGIILRDPKYQTRLIEQIGRLLQEEGCPFSESTIILDLGCGDGELVKLFCSKGYTAFGADILLEPFADPGLKIIDVETGKIPFPDQSFDFVFSDNVLEHVRDLSITFSEIRRLLKPGGTSLHLFPSRYRPIEAHVKIPFGGIHRSMPYLRFWAFLGVRTKHSLHLPRLERARANHEYLKEKTFYRRAEEILEVARSHFSEARFIERTYIKTSAGRPGRFYPIVKILPFLASLYGVFRTRVLFVQV
jgi:SAM-dependent methyltransferase